MFIHFCRIMAATVVRTRFHYYPNVTSFLVFFLIFICVCLYVSVSTFVRDYFITIFRLLSRYVNKQGTELFDHRIVDIIFFALNMISSPSLSLRAQNKIFASKNANFQTKFLFSLFWNLQMLLHDVRENINMNYISIFFLDMHFHMQFKKSRLLN
jgi:hypothetical protein